MCKLSYLFTTILYLCRHKQVFIKFTKMSNTRNVLILSLILFVFNAFSQKGSFNPTQTSQNIFQNISVLAHDSLNGREAGTPDELKAANYIASQFQQMGILPYFDNKSKYLREFSFKDGVDFSEGTTLMINGKSCKLVSEFKPLEKSTNGSFSGKTVNVGFGMEADTLKINDYKNRNDLNGKIFIIELSVPGGFAVFDKYSEFANLDAKIALATKKGAKAIVFVNSDEKLTDPRFYVSNNVLNTDIPVIFAFGKAQKKLLSKNDLDVSISVNIKKISKTGYNVAGFIDNHAEKTVVIGGHFDHLGWGSFSSRYVGKPKVHNGADDNASGTAAMLELARYFKDNSYKWNILFVAFSAEEKGLLGSAAFVKDEKDLLKNVVYMLNFDMVGRLDSISKSLNLIGTGSALEWDTLIGSTDKCGLKILKSASGIGGSDQTSFYINQIPVLFFFSGYHNDYHTPEDDVQKINFKGEAEIVAFAIRLMENTQNIEKLNYHKTKDESGSNRGYRGSVSMGIVPAFGDSGDQGLGVQAVQSGKAAEKAGLLKDDVIIKIGDYDVKNIQDYMKALKNFSAGQKTKVSVKRGNEVLTFTVEF